MALSNEMRRLTQGFVAAHDDRISMVATIRENTARELSGFSAAHESMAIEQRQRLADGRARLASDVSKMLESFDTAHQSMAVEQRQHLADGRARLASDVSKMRGDLADYVDGLRNNISKMLRSFDTARQSMAVEQRQGLADYMCGLQDNVSKMLKSFDTAHQSMAVEQRQRLADGRARLASDVSKMRGNLHADQSKARKIWDDFTTVMQERRTKKSGDLAPKAPAQVIPDDLTTISGIGAGRAERLNKMGICTFAQLAGSTPEEVRKALGTVAQLANVEEWIEEARELSSASGG